MRAPRGTRPVVCHSHVNHVDRRFCTALLAWLPAVHAPIYDWIDAVSPAMIVWTSLSISVTVYRLFVRIRTGAKKLKDSVMFTEGAGLLLTLVQIFSFLWALVVGDVLTAAMFAWWGPGFWVTVYYYLKAASEKRLIDWNQPCLGQTVASHCPVSFVSCVSHCSPPTTAPPHTHTPVTVCPGPPDPCR